MQDAMTYYVQVDHALQFCVFESISVQTTYLKKYFSQTGDSASRLVTC